LIFLFLNLKKIKVSDGHFFHFSIFQFLHEGFPKNPLDLSILILIEQFSESLATPPKRRDGALLGFRRPLEFMLFLSLKKWYVFKQKKLRKKLHFEACHKTKISLAL